MKAKLNHIGIAIEPEALSKLKRLYEILGLPMVHTELVDDQKVITHFLQFDADPEGSHIELLEPTDPMGPVGTFLSKRGPGIHHLSFRLEVGQLDRVSDELKASGFQLVYPIPKKGAHQMKINFIHPSSTGGVLIELAESDHP